MVRVYFICCIIFLIEGFSFSQHSINGKVIDLQTASPLIGAHVFLTGTQSGTITDENGFFELSDVPNGAAELTAQYIGYETWSRKITIHEKPLTDISIKLKAMSHQLGVIDVTAKSNNKRKRYLNRFSKAFIGSSALAKKCTLLNPEVLLFEEKNNVLTATAKDLLKIENKATGYLIYFSLEKFELKGSEVTYAGKPMFEELKASDSMEKEKWEKERSKAYLGSRNHFLYALANRKLATQGFEIRIGDMDNQAQFVSTGMALPKKIMSAGASEYERFLILNKFLQVIYKNEKGIPQSGNLGNVSIGRDHESGQSNLGGKTSNKYQVSYLYALKPKIQFFTDGRLAQPHLLLEYGHFGTERIAELMPFDYLKKAPPRQKSKPELNGFELDNISIDIKEIKKGGPPKDGIPSIDRPLFVAAEYANYLNPKDMVLGIEYNGSAKAYPIRILNWHEVVNDQCTGKKISLTYCPLCSSGMAFKTDNIGELGVSGLLYNSDVLLYDRETESLWSQIMGEAISGKKMGEKLEYITTIHTSWEKWQELYPHTLVLSDNTGFKMDYNKSPYIDYEKTDKLMFPVSQKNKSLRTKERIIGIEVNGKYKAYPHSVFTKKKNSISDIFNGKNVSIVFDVQSQFAEVKSDGEIYPSVSMFWFAWYSFHPDTEVFK